MGGGNMALASGEVSNERERWAILAEDGATGRTGREAAPIVGGEGRGVGEPQPKAVAFARRKSSFLGTDRISGENDIGVPRFSLPAASAASSTTSISSSRWMEDVMAVEKRKSALVVHAPLLLRRFHSLVVLPLTAPSGLPRRRPSGAPSPHRRPTFSLPILLVTLHLPFSRSASHASPHRASHISSCHLPPHHCSSRATPISFSSGHARRRLSP